MILLAFLLAFTLLRTSIADQCTTFRSGVACTVCAEYKKLLAFPDDDPLLQECRNCCSTTADLLLQREYSSAVLQVGIISTNRFLYHPSNDRRNGYRYHRFWSLVVVRVI